MKTPTRIGNVVAADPVLREVKLIAEAWDLGAYHVGSFPGGATPWAEWNGRYRDDVRRYWRGDDGLRPAFASRVTGSSDLYAHSGRGPEHTINFITCHDGFTLRDLVSYASKHNWENGEGNLDGSSDNYSANWGVEGETTDPAICELRLRMQKNLLATLFLSVGVPMLLGGDEFGVLLSHANQERALKKADALAKALEATRAAGLEPRETIIRGGTDGSRLTAIGLPTPNLSTGEHNPHSPLEWTSVEEMQQAVNVLVALAQAWSTERA